MSSLINRVPVRTQAALVRAVYALPKPVRRLIAGAPIHIDGQELALDAQLLLALEKASGRELVRGTPVQARAQTDSGRQLVTGPPIEPVATRSLTVGEDIPARLYTPDADTDALLVYYHGGGWVIGSLDSHDNTCRFLAREAGVKVLSVDYRLAPEHPFPAAVDDAYAAYEWAVKNADELGVRVLAVGGDSAGGNLAAVTAHQAAAAGITRPAFQLLFYPATDNSVRLPSRDLFAEGFFLSQADMDWFTGHYQADDHDPRFSIGRAADLTAMPPTYLATAGFDPLRDEGEAFAARLAAAGVPVALRRHADLIHGYANFLGIGSRFREAVAEAAGALRAGLSLAKR